MAGDPGILAALAGEALLTATLADIADEACEAMRTRCADLAPLETWAVIDQLALLLLIERDKVEKALIVERKETGNGIKKSM